MIEFHVPSDRVTIETNLIRGEMVAVISIEREMLPFIADAMQESSIKLRVDDVPLSGVVRTLSADLLVVEIQPGPEECIHALVLTYSDGMYFSSGVKCSKCSRTWTFDWKDARKSGGCGSMN